MYICAQRHSVVSYRYYVYDPLSSSLLLWLARPSSKRPTRHRTVAAGRIRARRVHDNISSVLWIPFRARRPFNKQSIDGGGQKGVITGRGRTNEMQLLFGNECVRRGAWFRPDSRYIKRATSRQDSRPWKLRCEKPQTLSYRTVVSRTTTTTTINTKNIFNVLFIKEKTLKFIHL